MGCADPPSKRVGAPHQCSRVNQKRSGWGEFVTYGLLQINMCVRVTSGLQPHTVSINEVACYNVSRGNTTDGGTLGTHYGLGSCVTALLCLLGLLLNAGGVVI